MALDIAMGGSTNTVLHILAIAHEAGVPFTMADINRLSRRVPNICKVAPSSHYHVEDVHRAGGIFTILGELDRAGLIHRDVRTVHAPTLGAALDASDIRRPTATAEARARPRRAPGGVRPKVAFSQDTYFAALDPTREGVHPRRRARLQLDGGLAVLHGNIAEDGCIVKTAGVDERLALRGARARLPLAGSSVRRHPRRIKSSPATSSSSPTKDRAAGPACRRCCTRRRSSRGRGWARCALITDGRFSGGTSGLSIGHVSPEAARAERSASSKRAMAAGSTSQGAASTVVDAAILEKRRAAMEARVADAEVATAIARCRRRSAPTL